MAGYSYGRDVEDDRDRNGRLSNGMFNAWTGQDYGYDVDTRRREQAEQLLQAQAVEADRSAAFRAQLVKDMREPTTEEKLLDPFSSLFRRVPSGQMEEQATYQEPGMDYAEPVSMGTTEAELKPEVARGIDLFTRLKSPNFSRSAAELDAWAGMAPEDRKQYETLVQKYGGQLPGGVRVNRPVLAPEQEAQLNTNKNAAQLQAGPGKAFGPQAARDLLTSNSMVLGGAAPAAEPTTPAKVVRKLDDGGYIEQDESGNLFVVKPDGKTKKSVTLDDLTRRGISL